MMQDSPQAIHAKAEGASIIQVELGATKPLIVLLWLSAFVSALATVGLVMAILSHQATADQFAAQVQAAADRHAADIQAAADRHAAELQQTSAHVNVLQYDLSQVKAQLQAQGLYEPTSH